MPLERVFLGAGSVLTTVLLARFAIDFSRWLPFGLALPAWLLVGTTVIVVGWNFARNDAAARRSPTLRERRALLAMVPLGFVASSLDCMGLSLDGCTTTCSMLKIVWFPVLVATCAVAAFTTRRHALTLVLALTFVSLMPHCVCRNPVNAWWIDRLGVSPMCLGWGFVASVVALGACAHMRTSRAQVRASFALSGAITGGSMAFFVGHHYFGFPW